MSEYRHQTTIGQSAIWLADQFKGRTNAYNASLHLSIEGGIDRDAVDRACERLIAGTPSLRLRLGIDAHGDVVQWLSRTPPHVNWLPNNHQGTLDQSIAEPFDTEGGALTRFAAARVHERRIDVVIVCHHAVIDGVGQAVLADNFFTCLGDTTSVQAISRYWELVNVVRNAEEKARAEDREYWRRCMADHPPSWPASVITGPGTQRESIPERCLTNFRFIARRLNVGLFYVVLGVIHDVLRRLGMSRAIICAAASVRPRGRSFDDIVGYFVNPVPLTAASAPNGTLAELITYMSPGWRSALRRRNFPLMTIAHEFSPSMRLDRIIFSFRGLQRIKSYHDGSLHVTADFFNRYVSPQTDLCLRFIPEGDRLMYEIQWSGHGPAALGEDFSTAFHSYLAEHGAER